MYTMLDASVIKISGEDSEEFLQNLITNDIKNTDEGSIYSMILNPQGRYLFDMFITKMKENEYLIEIITENASKLLGKLVLYKLGKNVDIEPIPAYKIVYTSEKQSGDDIVCSYRDPRFKKLGFRNIVNQNYLSNHEVSLINLYYEDKYNYAIPDGEIELEQEVSIPIEYGLEQINGISYTKGCYIGQELMTRTKTQGVLRKKIYKLESDEYNLTKLNREVLSDEDDEKIGVILSSTKNSAIAMFKIDK